MPCVQFFRAGFYVAFVVVTSLHFILVLICKIIEFIVAIVFLGNTLSLSLSLYPGVEMGPSDKLPEVTLQKN